MPFKTRTGVIFSCPLCGTETDVGVSPNYGSIANCSNAICHGQEAFNGFPQILTSPQQPETKQSGFSRLVSRITTSYINVLVAILLNLIVMALVGTVTFYVVRSAVEKQIPNIIKQEQQKNSMPPR